VRHRTEKADLIRQITELQWRLNRALARYSPDIWTELRLTLPQLKSLFFIASEGTTNFRKLATALGVTPSNVTGIVDRLVQYRLVSREENPEDRRILLLRATEEGSALVVRLRESSASHMAQLLARLNQEELSTLALGLAALVRVAETNQGESRAELS
jgi:DNA-binding MarR family transcriptional regulator